MLSLALAIAAISAPFDSPSDVPCSNASLQAVALALELMDPRESRYECDLQLLRQRYEDLQDAPAASDAKRFPDREYANAVITETRLLRVWLSDRYPLTREDWIPEAMAYCDWLYHVWDYARDARCGYYYVTVRRLALKKLRDTVGWDRYYAGCLPGSLGGIN